MSVLKQNLSVEDRLATLELYVGSLRGDLEGIREWIAAEHNHFIGLNAGQDRLVETIIDRLSLIEDRLEPAFNKLFPGYGKCLDEIDAIIETPRKR